MVDVVAPEKKKATPFSTNPILPNEPERHSLTSTVSDSPIPTNSIDLISLYKCPACMDFAPPPTLQCQCGHIICVNCRTKLFSCPNCRGFLCEEVVFMATDIALPGAVGWVMMQLCFGHCTMLVLGKQERVSSDQLRFAPVLLIETNNQADSSCTGSPTALYMEVTPRSIRDGMEAATAASDCLISDSNMARLFTD
ncbi:unnamed protein product [Taenia asiatica]|uniref:E3 ubiquitin-protein ligase n=1 Tax=Taenia asiatica TaxID=60517 RepID=A0A0R3VWF8_TAEAS|nr:unnamed protein product [Taenia asiatica]